MAAYSKDLCIIELDEASRLPGVRGRVVAAFLEGILCFQFRFRCKARSGRVRRFEDRVALPRDADEAVAREMAEAQFQRFLNTVGKLMRD
ncbi:hypothetical protein WJU23_14520 [Prosthecobacter sp. SYSU 5D2]|uniref:hypothetical protein n=1 Tax=Prosthecobacter sp. SYSU 5D2 TaxID=3134134 RepID=UPI0031FE4681